MRNELPVVQESRQPRGMVKVAGSASDKGMIMPGWISFEADNNTFYAADTFRLKFAISMLPDAYAAKWWSEQKTVYIEILAGFPDDPDNYTADDLDSLIYGKVDEVNYDPVSRTLELHGRDLTAELIDTKTTEKWQNLTASQIAEQLAKKHGLTPVVTATKEKSGKFYEIDHARLTDERSEWDLITWLAHEQQFVVYVKGKELHFEPQPKESSDPYILEWDEPDLDERGFPVFNGKSISFIRNLSLAKGVTVTVRSWNAKNKKAFTVGYPKVKARGASPGQAKAATQNYFFTYPGLTPEQALQKAQAKHKEITQHEVKLHVSMPADNILAVTDIIKVIGTDSAFDQIYYPDSINRTMSMTEGYSMTVTAKNVSPENIVVDGYAGGLDAADA